MGINIAIVTETGHEIELLPDPNNLTKALLLNSPDAGSPCLRFVDPYGDTIFNSLQIPLLIGELEETFSRLSNEEAKVHAANIVALARRAMQDVHKFVKFIGD